MGRLQKAFEALFHAGDTIGTKHGVFKSWPRMRNRCLLWDPPLVAIMEAKTHSAFYATDEWDVNQDSWKTRSIVHPQGMFLLKETKKEAEEKEMKERREREDG